MNLAALHQWRSVLGAFVLNSIISLSAVLHSGTTQSIGHLVQLSLVGYPVDRLPCSCLLMWRRRSQWALRSLKKTWPGKQRAINGVILFHPSFICSMTSAADVGFGRLGVELRWRSRGRAQDRGSLKTQWKSEPARWAAATRLRISSRKQMGGLLKSGLWTHQVVYMKTCAPLCKVQGAGNVLKIELFFIFSARICWLIMSRDSLLLSSSVSLPLMLCEAFQLVALITSQHIRLMQHSHDWKEKKEKRNGSWNCITAARRRSLHYQYVFIRRGEKKTERMFDRHWLIL